MRMKKKTVFTGAATALITPFRDGKIDYSAFAALIEEQISGGIGAILVAGTTGEATTLSYGERQELIAFAHRQIAGRVPLLAGCGSNCTANAVAMAKDAADAGADALLAVTPYYNKANTAGLIAHYEAIADATEKPLMLYNVPSRTGVSMTMELYRILAEHDRITAVKEASGDLGLLETLVAECGDRLDVYTGNDNQIVSSMKLGARGVISVYSNYAPRQVAELCGLCAAGEWAAAHERFAEMLPRINLLFREVNPIPIKYVLAEAGKCRVEYRLPLCPPSQALARELNAAFGK